MDDFQVDSDTLERNIEALKTKTLIEAKMYCSEKAKQMEGYAKRYRPWTDRTGHARQRLTGFIKDEKAKGQLIVGIAHGVDYGTSLELGHEKRYAILVPTLKRYSESIIKGFSHILERVKL